MQTVNPKTEKVKWPALTAEEEQQIRDIWVQAKLRELLGPIESTHHGRAARGGLRVIDGGLLA